MQLTRTGLIAGTPAFLAPEVARGQAPTAASDVFALGATLYAAVEGRPPFGLDDNAYALLHKVATGDRRAAAAGRAAHRACSCGCSRADPADRPTAVAGPRRARRGRRGAAGRRPRAAAAAALAAPDAGSRAARRGRARDDAGATPAGPAASAALAGPR